MTAVSHLPEYAAFEIPSHVAIVSGAGGLAKAVVQAKGSRAEIYLHGAHVASFRKENEPPLLFLSEQSQFTPGKAIRGGIPIIFPWFGGRAGHAAHGYARTSEWQLHETVLHENGSVSLRLLLPEDLSPCRVEYGITVADELTLDLKVENRSNAEFAFENCLHTYFSVGAIGSVSISGLQGCRYIDQLDGNARKTEEAEEVRIGAEVDRIYGEIPSLLEINDAALGRRIRLRTSGCRSAVVWNPWIEKSRRLADFGDEEYLRMVCVESGNVADQRLVLAPGESAALQLVLASTALPAHGAV